MARIVFLFGYDCLMKSSSIQSLEEFNSIRAELADLFWQVFNNELDPHDLLREDELDGESWEPHQCYIANTGVEPFPEWDYLAQILESPHSDRGWEVSPPDPSKGEKYTCFIHRERPGRFSAGIYVKIAVRIYPDPRRPEIKYQVKGYSFHMNRSKKPINR